MKFLKIGKIFEGKTIIGFNLENDFKMLNLDIEGCKLRDLN